MITRVSLHSVLMERMKLECYKNALCMFQYDSGLESEMNMIIDAA